MRFNPANIYANHLLKQVTALGVRAANISKVDEPHLKVVTEWSLVGDKIASCSVSESMLTEYEQSIRERNPSILLIVDIDGVLVENPFASVLSELGKVNMNWLRQAVSVVNHGIIWTNRFSPEHGPFLKSSLFPFLGREAADQLDLELADVPADENNIDILNGHDAKKRGDTLESFVSQDRFDIAYYVGSSWFDGKAVLQFAKKTTTPHKL